MFRFIKKIFRKKLKKKVWSRKGKCPCCFVKTGSKHNKKCTLDYWSFKKIKMKGNKVIIN